MNPDLPKTPREDLEIKLTAMLLGELSEPERAQVEAALSHDPELARLKQQIEQTLPLLQAATTAPAAQLQPKSRRRLLRALGKPPAPENQEPRFSWRWLVPYSAAAAFIALLAITLFGGLDKPKAKALSKLSLGYRTSEAALPSTTERYPEGGFVMDYAGDDRSVAVAAGQSDAKKESEGRANTWGLNAPKAPVPPAAGSYIVKKIEPKTAPAEPAQTRKPMSGPAPTVTAPAMPVAPAIAGTPPPAPSANQSQSARERVTERFSRQQPAQPADRYYAYKDAPPAPSKAGAAPANESSSLQAGDGLRSLGEQRDSKGVASTAKPAQDRANLEAQVRGQSSVQSQSGTSMHFFSDFDSDKLSRQELAESKSDMAPLPLKFPAPTLKGTPEDLPSGPNIEPLSETMAHSLFSDTPAQPAQNFTRDGTSGGGFGGGGGGATATLGGVASLGRAFNSDGSRGREAAQEINRSKIVRLEDLNSVNGNIAASTAPSGGASSVGGRVAQRGANASPQGQNWFGDFSSPAQTWDYSRRAVADRPLDRLAESESLDTQKAPSESQKRLAGLPQGSLQPELKQQESNVALDKEIARADVSLAQSAEPQLGVKFKAVDKQNADAAKSEKAMNDEERLGRRMKIATTTNALVSNGYISQPGADDVTRTAPVQPPATPLPEIVAAENPFSTFSLNVSDVSFKLAGASLESGKMPDPSSIRTEEFVNALNYRDPDPAPGHRVGFAWEIARNPFGHNRDLLRLAVKTAARGREPGRPLNLTLLVDNSGSMERADRVRIIRECLRVLAGELTARDRVSVVTFARTPRLWADGIAGDKAAETFHKVADMVPEGGTNLEAAMDLAYRTVARHYAQDGMNRIVLLTDGAANLGDINPDALKARVEAERKKGIALDCFGIGWEGYNDDLLEQLARNGDGRYGFVNHPEEASTEFCAQLAGALQVAASDVKVQVEFNPQRVVVYRQMGYQKHQLTKEQFRDNTVDAAEIGAAESGNALYSIQVNPQGIGPIATVRVRYRVPATGAYEEHAWQVPFQGGAVSLEQSSPAMRMAVVAGAFAEFLAGSPYAAEVNPGRLLSLLGNAPQTFSPDPRPKRLEWMIRQAQSVSGR